MISNKVRGWIISILVINNVFSITTGLFSQSVKEEDENLNVFSHWIKWNDPGSMALNHLRTETDKLYSARDQQIAILKTKADWQARQKIIKNKLNEIIGPFPKKEALNPEITGVVQKEGYRIEKIIYEPVPGYYAVGCLYIPDNLRGKAPAILNVIGHDQPGYKEQYYQVIITNLVKKGMIVFVIDPLGQGEHVQYYDTSLKFSAVGYSVIEHQYFGHICFLSGTSSAKYFIWDGIRAIDYLLTRKEVDPDNIGVTGFSGGGAVTGYLAAFDERVKVAIPCSWPTAYKALLDTKGSQDAETVLVGGLKKGISFEDLLEVRAPKPTLLTFTSRDEYLSLQGARQSYKEAKQAYTAYGMEENIQFSEDDAKHAMTPKIRRDIYAFFQKHFNLKGNSEEEKTDLPTVKDITVTPTGQIATYKGGKMIADLNKEFSQKLIESLERSRKNIVTHVADVKTNAKKISGYKAPIPDAEGAFINGRYQRDGYTVELDAMAGESGEYAIPFLLFKPDKKPKKSAAVIYLHHGGKIADAAPGGEIEKLVKRGFIVMAPDVLGRGETKSTVGGEYAEGNTCVLIGRSMVGIQAGDIVRVTNFLKSQSDVDQTKIGAIAFGEMGIPLIHAAAFEPAIKGVTLIGSLISYKNVVNNRLYKVGITPIPGHDYWHPIWVEFNWGVASALTAYDLPDLIGAIAPRKVLMAETKNSMMQPASTDVMNKELEFPKTVYASKQSAGNFKVLEVRENIADLLKWSID